jgi:hypothetical protein
LKSTKVTLQEKTSLKEAVAIAHKGTHCGMCRIDFLGTGLCPSGKKHGYLAYWPQGRMELVKHLNEGWIKPTEKLREIANSCTLCGICDKQCNFTTQLRPEKVARAIKEYVDTLDESEFQSTPEDDILRGLREIVGEEWASNDPCIIVSYIKSILPPDLQPDAVQKYYIALPETTEQVSKIIKFANTHNIPFMARSGGTTCSVTAPTVLTKAFSLDYGIVIDLLRLKKLEIHPESSTAVVGAGITSFELQKAAYKHKLRACVAEAGAHYCSNIATTGIISTWGNNYGSFADNFINVTIVDDKGTIKNHSDVTITNPYSAETGFANVNLTTSKIITESVVKLHPIFDDEVAVFVPFTDLKDALKMMITLGKRKVGLSLAILSAKYLAEFLSPTPQISKDFEHICKNYLKLNWVVSVIGTKDDQKIVEEMAECTMDQPLMKSLILGAPRFSALRNSEFLKILSEEDDPLKALFAGPMRKHLEKSLDPSPEQVAKVYDKDLQDFFKKVYSKPEMTDVVWLHAFRILPTRMLRQRMFMGPGGSIWTGDVDHMLEWIQMFADVGDKYNLEHSLGFITPLDQGNFAYMEYDYFYDHNDPDLGNKISKTFIETMEQSYVMGKVVTLLDYLFKGMYRKEHVLYPVPEGISKEEQGVFRDLIESVLGTLE